MPFRPPTITTTAKQQAFKKALVSSSHNTDMSTTAYLTSDQPSSGNDA